MLTCGEVTTTYLKGQPVMDFSGKPAANSGAHQH